MTEPSKGGAHQVARVAQALLFPAIVAGVFVGVLPRITDLDRVWGEITSLDGFAFIVLGALAAWNLVTYWPMLIAAMPGLTLAQAAVVCQSSTTVAMTVPGGGALAVGVSYAMYTSWGFTPAQVAMSAMATFLANMLFKLVLPIVAVALVLAQGEATDAFIGTAAAGAAIAFVVVVGLSVVMRSDRLARGAGRMAAGVASFARGVAGRKPVIGWADAASRFRAQMTSLLKDRWLPLTAAEIVSQLSVFAVMLASMRFVGVPGVSWAQSLAVFALVRLASAFLIIPGNVGLAELGYIGGLVLAGAGRAEAVASVLVFRFLTYFVQIPIGGVTYLVWQRNRRWRGALRSSDEPDAPQAARAVQDEPDDERPDRLSEEGADGHEKHPRVPATHQRA